jgi:hypothetical protein
LNHSGKISLVKERAEGAEFKMTFKKA